MVQISRVWFTIVNVGGQRVFLEDSLWPMNSEAKGPLHMILMEAYFNATRQQPMEPGL